MATATTGIPYIDSLTVNNLGTQDLRELLWLEGLKYGALKEILTLEFGVKDGEFIPWHGDMSAVGLPSNGCSPVWKSTPIAAGEKKWALGAYDIAETLCYKDLDNTVAQWARHTGTQKGDLTDTAYMSEIVHPTLTKAMQEMLWRLVWFGDLGADNIANGGIITAGINPELFKITDGLFKRLATLASGGQLKRVTIAANQQTTYATQKTGIETAGVAMSIFDEIIDGAPVTLSQKSNKVLLATRALVMALRRDIKRNPPYSDLQWTAIFSGFPNVESIVYNGMQIIALPEWDKMIQSYENTGTAWNKPYRAIYADKSSLMAGFESDGELTYLETWFEKKEQKNYIIAKDALGTQTLDDENIVYAF